MTRSIAPFIWLDDHDVAFHRNEFVGVFHLDLVKAHAQ